MEKPIGYYKSCIASALIMFLGKYLDEHDLGIVLGEAGTLRILADQIRVPDVAFLSWRHFRERVLPAEPVPAIAPDLAVDVISEGNTKREMARKLDDYFTAGVKMVWFIDAATQSAVVYERRGKGRVVSHDGSLSGGKVLPGFEVSLKQLFDKAGRRSRRKK